MSIDVGTEQEQPGERERSAANQRPAGHDRTGGDERRARLRTRHAHGLTTLMDSRSELRGVHALADFVDDAVRWSV